MCNFRIVSEQENSKKFKNLLKSSEDSLINLIQAQKKNLKNLDHVALSPISWRKLKSFKKLELALANKLHTSFSKLFKGLVSLSNPKKSSFGVLSWARKKIITSLKLQLKEAKKDNYHLKYNQKEQESIK